MIHRDECGVYFLPLFLQLRTNPRKILIQEIDSAGDRTRDHWMRCNNVTSRPKPWSAFSVSFKIILNTICAPDWPQDIFVLSLFLSFFFFFFFLFLSFTLFFSLYLFIYLFLRVFTGPQCRIYTPRDLQPKCPWVRCLRGSNSLWTRTLDRYTRAGLPECVVSTMSGRPPETAQNTKDTHPIPGWELKFQTPPGVEPWPPGWKAGTLPTR